MSNILRHADEEFKILMDDLIASGEDASGIEMQEHMHANVRELLEVLDKQGHSGFSIGYLFNMVKRLSMFEPLSDLTGADSEWMEVGEGVFQNRRCSSVFKNGKDGQAYDIDGYIGQYANGTRFTGGSLPRFNVDFPYCKKAPIVIHVDDDGEPLTGEALSKFLSGAEGAEANG